MRLRKRVSDSDSVRRIGGPTPGVLRKEVEGINISRTTPTVRGERQLSAMVTQSTCICVAAGKKNTKPSFQLTEFVWRDQPFAARKRLNY